MLAPLALEEANKVTQQIRKANSHKADAEDDKADRKQVFEVFQEHAAP